MKRDNGISQPLFIHGNQFLMLAIYKNRDIPTAVRNFVSFYKLRVPKVDFRAFYCMIVDIVVQLMYNGLQDSPTGLK